MIRFVIILAAFLSPFFFPFPATLVLMFAAATLVPPVALVIGVLVDALYLAPGAVALPWGTLWGVALTLLGLLVRRFIKARIISA